MHSMSKLSLLLLFALCVDAIQASPSKLSPSKLSRRLSSTLSIGKLSPSKSKKYESIPDGQISLEEQFDDLKDAVSESRSGLTQKILLSGGRGKELVNRMVVYPESDFEQPLLHIQASKPFPTTAVIVNLLKAGADPKLKNSRGEDLVHCAVKHRSSKCLQAIASVLKEIDITGTDNQGQNVFHKLSSKGQMKILHQYNNDVGTLVNHPDNEGHTPLYSVITRQHNDIATLRDLVKVLVANGADGSSIDPKLAEKNGVEVPARELANLLKSPVVKVEDPESESSD